MPIERLFSTYLFSAISKKWQIQILIKKKRETIVNIDNGDHISLPDLIFLFINTDE